MIYRYNGTLNFIQETCRKHFPGLSSFMTYHRFVTRLTRRKPLVDQEIHTLPGHLNSPPVFSGVRVTRSLVFCVCFVDRFLLLSFCTFSFVLSSSDSDYLCGIFKLFHKTKAWKLEDERSSSITTILIVCSWFIGNIVKSVYSNIFQSKIKWSSIIFFRQEKGL